MIANFCDSFTHILQGLHSLSGKTSYRKISWSLEAARFGSKLFQSLWNLAGTSAALLPRRLSNFRAIRPLQHPISRLRDFTRFGGKTSYRLVNRGPGLLHRLFGNRMVNCLHTNRIREISANFAEQQSHLRQTIYASSVVISNPWASSRYILLKSHVM